MNQENLEIEVKEFDNIFYGKKSNQKPILKDLEQQEKSNEYKILFNLIWIINSKFHDSLLFI
jgi:hypothetical protein